MDVPADLEAFLAQEYPRLVGTLTLYCGERYLAEELAQEALVRACERWSRVRGMDNPGGWAHHVAINLANSRFRHRGAERRAEARLRTINSPAPEPVDAATALSVRAAVAALPKKQRAVLVLRYFGGFSVRETADLLAIPEGSVKRLAHQAIASLRSSGGLMDLREVSDVT